MASPLFHHCLLQQLSAELGVGVHLLRSLGLVLQLAQLEPQRRVHAAELAAPLRVRRRADAEPRHTSGTGAPASGRLGTVMIWLSVKRDFLMETSSSQATRKFHVWGQLSDRGITNPPSFHILPLVEVPYGQRRTCRPSKTPAICTTGAESGVIGDVPISTPAAPDVDATVGRGVRRRRGHLQPG